MMQHLKIEDIPKNAQNWPLGSVPGGRGSKILPIWWKSDENWRFSKKTPKIGPLGGVPGGGQKNYLKFSSKTISDIMCEFGEDRAKNEEIELDWQKGEGGK